MRLAILAAVCIGCCCTTGYSQTKARSKFFKTPTPTPETSYTTTPTPSPTWTSSPTSSPTLSYVDPTPTPIPTLPTPTPTAFLQTTVAPPPQLALWQSNMLSYGKTHCEKLLSTSLSFDSKLTSTYYDAEWVYYQIGDYTKDTSWYTCARNAESIYRDQYVLPNNGQIPGYLIFSHGLSQDYLRTGDLKSQNAGVLMSQNAAYALDSTPLSWTSDFSMSREVAYNIMSYINAEDLGQARRSRLYDFKKQAFGHLDQWFISKTATYIRPFMVALTAQALITYEERIGDPAILPALINAADWMWANMWIATSSSFKYTNVDTSKFASSASGFNTGGTEPAPDLNLLIAPLYSWLYYQTGEARFLNAADKIFAGGVTQSYVSNAKQFNQNYRWSFEYIKWRSLTPLRTP